ncbi:putative oxidoreductase [Colletotrichum godetiae]|uniref:D-xylose 1-dehydrogenase (NADP(+), D-xylono-1,5-lactone-forming) n=1 Tax=Colletotrichum godetiae TaxID=1209918 RepID=A0AAJ0EYQ4_9PEZI|nr:putative oxidoreductase [Colletotrichum godetiae]KAK1676450.1 putative oxidoreductase [Colletotrichum godetiae]
MALLPTRLYKAFHPPMINKSDGAIRVGVLGAAKIVSMALLTPALSHPEVIVQAIAARDRSRAEDLAKKHGIPEVKDTYQDILDDPEIDAVFVPLPNALHYEWSVRAIRAGKHVLVEKPSVDNATEANMLFNMPELSPTHPNPRVLLEAMHNKFHPALHKFLTFIAPADVIHVHTDSMAPAWFTTADKLNSNYKLGGGSIMALGTYNFAVMRMIFGQEPEECLECDTAVFVDDDDHECDYTFKAKFRFPNGTGDATTTVKGPAFWKPSEARVTHKEVAVSDKTLPDTQKKTRTRLVTLHGFMHAVAWHRIDVKDSYKIRNVPSGQIIKKWVESSSHTAYTYRDAEDARGLPDLGEFWWTSFRYQLEAFVNRIKGRETHYWVTGEDSIKQMKMIDMAYEKSGLRLRPTSTFR